MRVMTFGEKPNAVRASERAGDQSSERKIGRHTEAASSTDDLTAVLDAFTRSKPTERATDPSTSPPRFQAVIQDIMARLQESWQSPPQEEVTLDRPRKVAVAQQLTNWMTRTLDKEGVQLAVIARQGGLQHKKHDPTGMYHSGIALFHPRDKQWKVYNVTDEKVGGQWRCAVQWTKPEAFFYQQGGYQPKSLMLIPDKATRERMTQALLKGDYKKLLFTNDYHLVSDPGSEQSLNCNKWVLMNVLAAQKQDYNPRHLVKAMRDGYQADTIQVHPLVRPFAWYQPHVKSDEVPWVSPIQTVTVNSLVNSGLFEKAVYSPEVKTEAATGPMK